MHYTTERQITVVLENQPGRLGVISRLLAAEGVNILALSVIDSIEQGVVRLVTSDAERCRRVLAGAGLYLLEADVLAVDTADRPGRLADLCDALAAARVNVDYAYTANAEPGADGRSRVVFKVSSLTRAREVFDALAEG